MRALPTDQCTYIGPGRKPNCHPGPDGRPSGALRRERVRLAFGLLAAATVLGGIFGPASPGAPVAPAASAAAAPWALPALLSYDWDDVIEDILDEIVDTLDDARERIDDGASHSQDAALLADLDWAVARINQVLDPAVEPNLEPSDAGAIDDRVNAGTLAEYADVCVKLASAAAAESRLKASADHEYIGTKLRTIRHLIERTDPHGYRSLATSAGGATP